MLGNSVFKDIFVVTLNHWSNYVHQIPTSAVAKSVYKFLEAFAKLEKRLSEGQEGSAATRGQPNIREVWNKLDKFIKVLGPREIQVLVFTRVYIQNMCTP